MTAPMTMKSGISATRISTLITAWMPFFSGKDDQDERCSTGLYLVLGKLDKFYPDIKARIFCGDSFVSIDPNIVMEGLEQPFPKEWLAQVSIRSRKPERFKKPDKRSFRDLLEEAFL